MRWVTTPFVLFHKRPPVDNLFVQQATGLSHRQNRPVTAYIGTHTEGYDIYDPVPSRSDCCKLAALPIFANFTLLERDATRQEKATPLLARAKGQ